MKLGGFSLNIFSLGGLVVAIGVVLDNSIVVLENITRLQHLNPEESSEEVAVKGTAEVGPAILAATLSFLALFLPFMLVPGMVSLLFHELILVISGIVVVSLLLAITLTPMLTAVLTGKPRRSHGEGSRFERFFAWVTEWYGVLLTHTLRHRRTALAGFVILLFGAVLLAPFLGSEFLPQIDDGRVVVKVKLPTGTPVGETNKLLSQVEAKLVGDADIEVKIRGDEIDKLFDLARQAADSMNKLQHFTNVYVSMDLSKPEYQVVVDRTRTADMSLSVVDAANTIRSLVSGAVATKYREGDYFYNIRVMIPEKHFASRQDIENLVLNSSQGGYLRLRDVATVTQAVGPVEIAREDQVKEVIVRGDAAGVSVGQALAELQAGMGKLALPVGYVLSYGGQAQMMAEMQRTLTMVLAFAIFFSFVVLAVQFNSLRLPSLILGCVPFCLAGMIYALYLTGLPLGVTVVIGVLIVVALFMMPCLYVIFAGKRHQQPISSKGPH